MDGQRASLGGRALDVLAILVHHRDRVVTKNELLQHAWPGLVVEENNLAVQISSLRRILGADAIVTSAGRGYRFALPIDAGQPLPGATAADGSALDVPTAAVTRHPVLAEMPPPGLRSAASAPLYPTIAVLPLHGHCDGVEAYGPGDIVTDLIIAALSRCKVVNVTSRLSTNAFRDGSASLETMAHRLGAQYFVTGRCLVDDTSAFVGIELIEAASGEVMWSGDFKDHPGGLIRGDGALIQYFTQAIMRTIFAAEVNVAAAVPLPSAASHTLLLAAIAWLYRLSASDFARSYEALCALCERAPRHPAPLAWLARWHLFRVVQGWSQDRELDGRIARDFALRALDLDPDSSLALTMMGNVHTNYLKDVFGAEALYDRALERNPNESLAWLQKGNARSFRADGRAAIENVEKALSLSPLDPSIHFYHSILASAALTAGEYRRAIEAAEASLRRNDTHVSTYRVLAISQVLSGQLEAGRQTVRQILKLEPTLTVAEFVARSPAAGFGLIERFGDALHRAGLPSGTTKAYTRSRETK